jgi:hypothetical protein
LEEGQNEGFIAFLIWEAVDCFQDLAEASYENDEEDAESQGDEFPLED